MTSFTEIINTKAPHLKAPLFIIDHNVKDVEKPFPSVASYMVLLERVDQENPV